VLEDRIREDAGAVVVLPLARQLRSDGTIESWSDFARLNVSYMNWAYPAGAQIINGYSGQRTQIMREFPRAMVNFPDPRSTATLGSIINIRYIVVHTSQFENFDPALYFSREELATNTFEK